jgi:hypothetical protein
MVEVRNEKEREEDDKTMGVNPWRSCVTAPGWPLQLDTLTSFPLPGPMLYHSTSSGFLPALHS